MTDQREKRIQDSVERINFIALIRDRVEEANEVSNYITRDIDEADDWIEFLSAEVSRLQVERDKAIGALQGYALMGLEGARNVLSELGVSHETT